MPLHLQTWYASSLVNDYAGIRVSIYKFTVIGNLYFCSCSSYFSVFFTNEIKNLAQGLTFTLQVIPKCSHVLNVAWHSPMSHERQTGGSKTAVKKITCTHMRAVKQVGVSRQRKYVLSRRESLQSYLQDATAWSAIVTAKTEWIQTYASHTSSNSRVLCW